MTLPEPRILRRPIALDPGQLAPRIGSWLEPALLEGGHGTGQSGRWSILAARPRGVFESSDGTRFQWSGRPLRFHDRPDALEGLARLALEYRLADPRDTTGPDEPPFQGGLIGYLSYDLAPSLERLPRRAAPDSGFAAIRFGLYDTFVLVDHHRGSSELWAVDLLGEGLVALEDRWRLWKSDLEHPADPRPRSVIRTCEGVWTRGEYLDAARKVLGYIASGDIYQANLSQRFEARGCLDPLGLYLRLKEISPAPHASYLAWDGQAIVGASPELFFRLRGDRIVTRPIKGTRPRSAHPLEDARLARELAESPKDRAELTMIVDLERNDLGRVCRFGSVRVTEAGSVESFEQVHHLVATIEGQLREGVGPVDVIRSVFPGGSITGAPKIRSMEIIDEIEPHRRSLYTGSVGYLSQGGQSAFNIAIRTLLVEGDRVTYQVGGGIVADSDPDLEYAETLHKARGMLRLLEEFR